MAALFGHGNPLATPVGQMIEKSTDGSQASENWGLFMEICDVINDTDEGPKDAIKAIKKRLSQNMGKNHTAVMYTLTCLETCVKNCGKKFHQQVATKDFMGDLVKIIGPKYDPPTVLQEKVLSSIQSWSDAFKGQPDLKEVEKCYNDLKGKGIEFPMTDLDHMAPIHTPKRSQPEPEPVIRQQRQPSLRAMKYVVREEIQDQPPQIAQIPVVPAGPINPTTEQMGKLKSELTVVNANIKVMGDMLTELDPSSVDPSDLELLQELNRTNRQMQQRLVDLLDKIANEEVTNELLRVNDDINNVFLRYERFERYRTGQSQTDLKKLDTPITEPVMSPPSYNQVEDTSNPPIANLIDLGDDGMVQAPGHLPPINTQMQNMNIGSNPAAKQSDDFDMFAQSRQSFEQNKVKTQDAYANQQEDQFTGGGLGQAVNAKSGASEEETLQELNKEFGNVNKLQSKDTDYDEMEQWLTSDQKKDLEKYKNPQDQLSSSEFDQFLAERSTGANSVPTIAAAAGQRSGSRNRQLQKDEEENPLFAL
ncbi:TOM1-like protein 2 isoform X1 [Mytilus edulis]|uniref:TOM1-like protein 2 isoform X1 n=1 Tax=Mytilus edulis TaxID=6550 RepID=UPI0039EEEE7B